MGDYLTGVPLSRKMSKKYAKCKRKFELGLWGHDLKLVKGVYLTTWSEAKVIKGKMKGQSKNDLYFLKQDLRELRRCLNKMGCRHESCFVPEKSPRMGLLHLHGFMRFEKEYEAAELHAVISKLWGKIHDSPVVWVKDLWSLDGVMKYDLKDAVKNYLSAEMFGCRVYCSKGWLRLGWKEVERVLVRWGLEHSYPVWVKTEADILQFEEDNPDAQGRYVYLAWDIVNDYFRRWCNGECVVLDFNDGSKVYMEGENFYEKMDERRYAETSRF